jgi:hypothetical protein
MTAVAASGGFAALLAELGESATLAKAAGADLDTPPKGKNGKPMIKGDDGEWGEDNSDDEGGDDMGKALSVTLEDGTRLEAVDATDILKGHDGLLKALQADVLPQFMAVIKDQGTVIKKQGDLLKALQVEVGTLRNTGRGRSSALTVHDQPRRAAAPATGPKKEEVLAKADSIFAAGKLDAVTYSEIAGRMERGERLTAQQAAALGLG